MGIRLGDLLLQEKLITTAQLEEALKYQVIFGGKLGTNLIEMGAIDEVAITGVLSRKFGVPAVDPDDLLQIPPQALQVVPRELAERYGVVPLRLNNRRLALAMTDPSDLKVLDEIAFRTGCIIQPLVATELRIVHALEQVYGIPRGRRYINVLPEMGGGNRPFGGKPAAAPTPQPAFTPQFAPAPVIDIPDLDASVEEEIVELAPADELLEAPPAPPAPVTLGEELITARNRDDILDALARFLGREFLYSAILLVRGEVALGWKATAAAREVPGFADLEIPLDEASVLKTVAETRGYHLGPLPRTPFNSMFLQGMGGRVPERALLVPLLMMGRVVAILYVDAPGIELGPLLPELQKLTAKAAMAFEILVLQNKILSF